jgi:hypothetical protein
MSFNKKTNLYEGYIYQITNKKSLKKYIGQTKTTVNERYSGHKYAAISLKRQTPLYDDMRLFGIENFEVVILEKIEKYTLDELMAKLNNLEKYYISVLGTIEHGYNQINGGGGSARNYASAPCDAYDGYGNLIRSFESCYDAARFFNISLVTPGDICRGNLPFVKIDDKKIVFRFKNDNFLKYPIYRKHAIYQFDLNGNLLNVFDTPKDFCMTFDKKNTSGLYRAIKNKQVIYGFYFSFENKFDYVPHKNGISCIVNQYDFEGNYINTFLSAREASMKIGNGTENGNWEIMKCCKGEIPYARGFVWRFVGDSFDKYPLDLSKSYYRKVVQYSLDGVYIASFISSNHAYRAVTGRNDYKGSHILSCCKGKKRFAYGYVWRFEGDPFDKYRLTRKQRIDRKTIIQMDMLSNQMVCTYKGIKDVIVAFANNGIKVSKTGISRACRNNANAYGYKWKYV